MRMLAEAIKFAVIAHGSSLDKGGDLAILHPLSVMLSMETQEEMIVAILHDVIEDTDVFPERIKEMFGDMIYDAVVAISRREDEKYFDYIARVKGNALATRVKLKDLDHNSSARRLAKLPEADRGIVKRYEKARRLLMEGFAFPQKGC